ncbi:DMT family transporter [Photobacterium damselae subsp. damselae]|uniref:DMT family transporter n=1 Tax=Photobacterium damselae subsp. damselae TaxID=85581 RepID=A0A855RLQ0_PHODD|nr:DMT family transporter [Photobacterium damselae]AWK83351.1 EamA family transporter [Photobacterium damselae]ELI6448446.1 DMT family transporter [Photobacterium damselae]ELV7515731.1 DMT family transporter [Photobacterium damselae]KAB1174218.1 DMT family transporter [Photobacterium damselae subsp. damselae]KAB1180409.1 DMT family transporter [Photobacterium damselae subsp. damselae]
MNRTAMGWTAAIFIGLLWGIPWIVGTPILEVMDAQVLVWARYTIAFLTLAIILNVGIATGKLEKKKDFKLNWENRHDIIWSAACGIIGQGAFSFLSFLSLDYITASENGVIQGLIPILILTVGFFRHNARFTTLQMVAAVGAFVGVAILVMDPKSETNGFNIGHLICFGSAASFATMAYARAELAEKYGSVATMFHQFIFASIGFGLYLVFTGADLSSALGIFSSPLRILCITILGVGISGISYLIYIYAMERVGVDGTGMALNLMPLSSFVLAVFALGESVTPMRLLAIAVVIVSMMMFMKFGNDKAKETEKQKSSATKLTTQKA